ncbi:GNAT family N-acetyltransferase [Blastococcus sp. CT_GayMR16]|uniref:GNAT family N-acetyltransferase n=1 Tax=Blastococcus sp. CT_GayMR16 TaxID=2559607 RepID=UPI0010744FF0|nr:GNAT family N-acetyltransferase [Blastococcus sp. CT_GayMR16]TFV89875.1 GNAT family N-acetyltransferase [Blastococcus sp. CT_GayMR16]
MSPPLPDGFSAVALSDDDVAAVAALLAAAEQVDSTGEYPDAEDVAEWWQGWGLDPGHDGLAVRDAAGIVVAYVTVMASPTFRDAFAVYLEGRVRPDVRGRGIGRALLAWQLDRGTALHAERHPEAPGALTVEVPGGMPALESLVRRAGLAAERWYREMQRPLTDVPETRPVAGVELVPFTWDRDDEIRRAHNAAFTRHHGSSERDPEAWRALFTGQRGFRPDLSRLAVEDGAVVGYVLSYVYEADTAARGTREVVLGQIGVLPAARGRGVASALIAEVLRTAAGNDCASAGLGVDTDNVTGALRLYEGLGFRTVRTRVSWSLDLPPVAESVAQ